MLHTACAFDDGEDRDGHYSSRHDEEDHPDVDAQEVWELVMRAAEVNEAAHGARDPWWRKELFREKHRLVSAAIVAAGTGHVWARHQVRGDGPGCLVLVSFMMPALGCRALHIPYDGLSREARAFVDCTAGPPPAGA